MKPITKSDCQIAASQYAKGFCDRKLSPMPQGSGFGIRFYHQGFEDSNLPASQLASAEFLALTDEEGDEGKAFVSELRKVAATAIVQPGEAQGQAFQRIYVQLMNGASVAIEAQEKRAAASAIVDELVRRGLTASIGDK